MARAIQVGEVVYTAMALLGTGLALIALVDSAQNLRVALRWRDAGRAAAWLWLGLSVVALLEQSKLAALGLVVIATPPSPEATQRPTTVPIIVGFIITAGIVLGIQMAMIVARSALRRHAPARVQDPSMPPHPEVRP